MPVVDGLKSAYPQDNQQVVLVRLAAIPFIRGLGEWIKPVRSKRTGVSQPPQVRILYPLPLESWQSLAYCTRLEVVQGLKNLSEVQILPSPPFYRPIQQTQMD